MAHIMRVSFSTIKTVTSWRENQSVFKAGLTFNRNARRHEPKFGSWKKSHHQSNPRMSHPKIWAGVQLLAHQRHLAFWALVLVYLLGQIQYILLHNQKPNKVSGRSESIFSRFFPYWWPITVAGAPLPLILQIFCKKKLNKQKKLKSISIL